MKEFNIFDTKTHLSKIVQDALNSGESFIISRYNEPVLRCVPLKPILPPEVRKENFDELAELLEQMNSKKKTFQRSELDKEKQLLKKASSIFSRMASDMKITEERWAEFQKQFEKTKEEIDDTTSENLELVSMTWTDLRVAFELGLYLSQLAESYIDTLEKSITLKDLLEIAEKD